MATRWARFARGWVVAGFSIFVAALSHTLGGAATPGPLAVVLSMAFAGVVCVGLSGRALSTWRVSLSVLASQLIFHGLFSLGGTGGALATDAAAGVHQHPLVAGLVGSAAGAGSHGAGSAHLAGGHGAAMWLAHAAAALVTIIALRHGEHAFWGLFASASVVIRSLFEVPVAVPRAARQTPTTAPVFTPRDLGVLLSARRHRGPPLDPRVA